MKRAQFHTTGNRYWDEKEEMRLRECTARDPDCTAFHVKPSNRYK